MTRLVAVDDAAYQALAALAAALGRELGGRPQFSEVIGHLIGAHDAACPHL